MADSNTDNIFLTSPAIRQRACLARLKNRREFLFVQHNGVRQVMPHFILQAAIPAPHLSPASSATAVPQLRAGLTASKKVGNAVLRNRAKRRMRALLAPLRQMQTPERADYVLVARHSLVGADFSALTADFAKAAARVNSKLLAAQDQEPVL